MAAEVLEIVPEMVSYARSLVDDIEFSQRMLVAAIRSSYAVMAIAADATTSTF